MSKRKLVGSVGLIIAIVLIGSYFVYMHFTKKVNKAGSSTSNILVIPKSESEKTFDSFLTEFNKKNYDSAITTSQKFGGDSSNQLVDRLNAYKVCIDSARLSDKKDVMTLCHTKIQELIALITDADTKQTWTTLASDAMSGATTNKPIDSGNDLH